MSIRSSSFSGNVLRPIEIASMFPSGFDQDASALEASDRVDPHTAFRDTMRDALIKPPCLVSFSGGRDSSTVLTAAVEVARAEGLPLPIPATMHFPNDSASREDDWQTLVLDHLGITERIVYELTDEVDLIGDDAASVLRKHGVLFPVNVHFHVRIFRDAAGGSVLTGIGGDEVATAARDRWTENALSAGRPTAKTLRNLAYHLSPPSARFAIDLARTRPSAVRNQWLSPRAVRELRVLTARDRAAEPLGWGRILREELPRHRYFTLARAGYQTVADDFDVSVVHPFIEPATLQALASHNPFEGVGGRQALVRLLGGDSLPTALVERQSKAEFGHSFWTERSRDFAKSWRGGGLGVLSKYVDEDGLRQEWSKEIPDARSMLILQQLWLNTAG